jgi:hypothetical protein
MSLYQLRQDADGIVLVYNAAGRVSMGATTIDLVYVNGNTEKVEGVPIGGTPFFAHECELTDGRKAWRVTHVGSGAAIGFGWYKQDDAVCGIHCWWRQLDGEARAVIESVTNESLDVFKSWKREEFHRLRLDQLYELCDFTWTKFFDGGI